MSRGNGHVVSRVAPFAVQESGMRSIGNLELMTNPIGTRALESARVPSFRCFGHSGSLSLVHPTAVCLPPQRGSTMPG